VKLFNYNYKQQLVADQKVEEILRNFDLSFPEGLDMQKLVRDNKSLVRKIQELNPHEVKQADLIAHSEEMDLELMADDNGKIIIMDGKDLGVFINLLNDDYVTSDLTGKKYIIRGKKVL
jgi:predicted RNA-binding protein with EMAP domain